MFRTCCESFGRAIQRTASLRSDQKWRERTVHFPKDVFAILTEHMDTSVGPELDAPIFTGKTGQPLRPGAFWRAWNKARKSTGPTQFHFHDLRHFAATQFSATGASTREVMERGGWKSAPMVVRYQHATDERDSALAEYLPVLGPVACPDPDDQLGDDDLHPHLPAKTTQKAPGERLELST
jgi:integrase